MYWNARISKAFGGTKALKEAKFHARKAEIHALLGENGAGKSTLMNIIIGLCKADSGVIKFEGKPYVVHNPVDAMARGISMIHQELNPLPDLTIAENIFLHREDTKGPFLDKKEQNRRTAELLEKFNFKFSPKTLMKRLTLAQVQMVEIIKAVSSNARLIIMDEPTSSLDANETERLLSNNT